MKNSENKTIDIERDLITNQIREAIAEFKSGNFILDRDRIMILKKTLFDFRMMLAYNRATESFESKFDWTESFNELNENLDLILKSFDEKDGTNITASS